MIGTSRYLKECSTRNGRRYRIRWRGIVGVVEVATRTVAEGGGYNILYRRHTKLGDLLRTNEDGERKFISDALEADRGERPHGYVGV